MQTVSQSPSFIENQKSAFDETLVAEPHPVVSMGFPYNINADLFISRTNGSGTVTQSGVSALVKTAAGTSSFAQLLTKRTLKYNPGQGTMIRFAGFFDAGAANNTQFVGYGSINDGFAFGYSGTAFGILRRYGGASETRTLTIATKSSHAENITITLNGVTKSVAVTNGADTTVTANEIAAANYAETGGGWTTEAVGSTVIFRSYRSGALSGTYSLSGATSAVGTFAQTVVGVAATDSFVASTSWNADKANGTAKLPSIDPTKGNVYQIRFEWLGYGCISYYIAEPTTGKFVLVHRIQYPNQANVTSINNPSLPFMIESVNTTNNTAIGPTISSIGMFHEGPNNIRGVNRSIAASATGITTEKPVLTIRNKSVFQSKLNRIVVDTHDTTISTDGTKNVTIKIYKDATLVAASFTDIGTNVSPVAYDTAATSLTGGTLVHARAIAKIDNVSIQHPHEQVHTLQPGEQHTITITSSASVDVVVSFEWEELF